MRGLGPVGKGATREESGALQRPAPSSRASGCEGAEFGFIAARLGERKAATVCRAPGAARWGHYQWASRPDGAHDLRDLGLARLVGGEHGASMGICGAPKASMRPETSGVATSRRRVARIMREHGWRGVTRSRARRASGERRAAGRTRTTTWPGATPARRARTRRGSPASPTRARTRAGPASPSSWMCGPGWWWGGRWARGSPRSPPTTPPGWPSPAGGRAGAAPFGPRRAARWPAPRQGHARQRHQAVHGACILAVGQRRDRVAGGRHQVRVRARGDAREPRAGSARALRAHRASPRQDRDSLGPRLGQPRRIREDSRWEKPSEGGMGPVNANGADSESRRQPSSTRSMSAGGSEGTGGNPRPIAFPSARVTCHQGTKPGSQARSSARRSRPGSGRTPRRPCSAGRASDPRRGRSGLAPPSG